MEEFSNKVTLSKSLKEMEEGAVLLSPGRAFQAVALGWHTFASVAGTGGGGKTAEIALQGPSEPCWDLGILIRWESAGEFSQRVLI